MVVMMIIVLIMIKNDSNHNDKYKYSDNGSMNHV